MPSRFSSAFSWLILFAVTSAGTFALAQAPGIFVTPVPNTQFSAVVQVRRSIVAHDGSIAEVKSIREIARDSRGRVHNEVRESLPLGSVKTPQVLNVHLYDPQTRISTSVDPRTQTFWQETIRHPPSTVPPTIRYASPASSGLPPNEFTKEEDLGIQEVDGVPAHGLRETQTIPAESSGIGKDVVVTDEFWYSDDLRINLVVKHSDPRTGEVKLTVTQVTRTEPDSALFEIPQGYKPGQRN